MKLNLKNINNMENLKHETEQAAIRKEGVSRMNENDVINYLLKRGQKVEDGELKGYKLQLFIKNLSDAINAVKDQIRPTVLDELKDSFDDNGYNFKVTSGSGKYDFSCFDEWKEKNKKIKEIEDNMKLAYKKGKDYVDSDTGEVYPVPEFKPYSNRIVITKNK